ncbi:MAG: type IV pili methyl-accepting chemotaxis transducer N-terminal domain-containing protein [Roseibium sp.]
MDLNEDDYGKLINITGRQRMLSQRIGFLFLTFSSHLGDDQEIPTELWTMQKTALTDFQNGVEILLKGDPEAGIPKLDSQRIRHVLDNGGTANISRFLRDSGAMLTQLSESEIPDQGIFGAFVDFVLTDLLQTLQGLVVALEEDFACEMQKRRTQREEDTQQVKDALKEIQKASKFSRMIALNAKISADRAGPYGKEFGALTEELKMVSSSITDSSENILKHLEGISAP